MTDEQIVNTSWRIEPQANDGNEFVVITRENYDEFVEDRKQLEKLKKNVDGVFTREVSASYFGNEEPTGKCYYFGRDETLKALNDAKKKAEEEANKYFNFYKIYSRCKIGFAKRIAILFTGRI